MTAAEERHERALRETAEVRRKAVDVAVDQLVYDLGRSSTEAWALVDRLRSMNAQLIATNRALEARVAELAAKQRSATAQEKPDADLHQG